MVLLSIPKDRLPELAPVLGFFSYVLNSEINGLNTEIRGLNTTLKAKDETIQKLEKAKDETIKGKDETIKGKDETIQKLEKAKDETIKAKDDTIRSKDNETESTKKSHMLEKDKLLRDLARKFGVMSGRFYVEWGMMKYSETLPTKSNGRVNNTDTAQKYVNKILTGGKLTSAAKKHLDDLEKGSVSEKDVVEYVKNIYDKLSREVHNPGVLEAVTGHVCTGAPVSRAAVAILILQLQSDGFIDVPVKYLDETFTPMALLENGKISEVPNASAETKAKEETS